MSYHSEKIYVIIGCGRLLSVITWCYLSYVIHTFIVSYDAENAALGSGYQLPPPEIKDIVDAPPLPALSFSPQRDKILFLKRRALPPLEELAKPEEKLAGIRIDGKCNTRSRM